MTEFEKLCDDAVSGYLSAAQFVPFGEAPLIGYLAARVAAYCRVSTDKEDQANSFETQQRYFREWIDRNPR